MADPDHDGFTGPATLTVDGRDLAVHVLLDARHEPQDGKLHWFGRVRVDPGQDADELDTAHEVTLRTSGAAAPASLGDVDPWGRYRVTGVGLPPYPLDEPTPDD